VKGWAELAKNFTKSYIPRRMTDPDGENREPRRAAAPGSGGDDGPSAGAYAGFGLQLLAAILLFLYLGQWLDRHFGTKGILTVVCVLFGAGAAFYNVYRRLMADQRRADEARRR
jgi:hypothetical protein